MPAKFAAERVPAGLRSLPCVRARAIQSRMPVAEFTAPTRSTPCSRPPCDGTVQAVAHHGMQCIWCPKRDSNSHDRSRGILSPLRLPIPPLGHGDFPIPAGLAGQQARSRGKRSRGRCWQPCPRRRTTHPQKRPFRAKRYRNSCVITKGKLEDTISAVPATTVMARAGQPLKRRQSSAQSAMQTSASSVPTISPCLAGSQ